MIFNCLNSVWYADFKINDKKIAKYFGDKKIVYTFDENFIVKKMENQEIFLRNNTGSKSKSAIVDGFVVRTNEFSHIEGALKASKTVRDVQNTIIIGQRGAGKTTLMHRLGYAILDENNLSKRFLPILFSEEQYNLSDLTNLWEAVAIGIEDNFYKENLAARIDDIVESGKDYEKESLKLLQDFLISKDKVAILFIENINFFLKKLSEDEKKRLKKILTSDSPFRVIGSSTSYNDGTIDFEDSFYKFFNIVQLDSLTQEECEKLLIKIGQQYGEEQQIRDVIANFSGRVEALRRLTGGVPRTISYLFQIFLDNENGKAIKDLYLLIDTLTLLYKSELDQLSTQQQKVIDAIARKWDAISVKEIAKRTRLESKNISSILSYLEKNQLVEKVPTPTKNHLYRIKERFMNIWYLMRFGRTHDKENVIWLVRFFDAWCDESELTKRLRKHINNLKDGKYDVIAAIDMENTFLSCENIPDTLKEELIKTTNSILPNRLLKSTKTTGDDALAEVKILIKEEKFDEAIKRLGDVDKKDIKYFMLATSIYLMKGEPNKALESAKAALVLEDQNPLALISLAIIYDFYLEDKKAAIDLYEKCLELPQPHPYAANRLGNLYRRNGDYENAIKYHELAVTKNFKQSLISLGNIYLKLKDLEGAEKYYREAIKFNQKGAFTKLAKVLTLLYRVKDTEKALIEAVAANEKNSNINLGRFYLMQKRPSFKKAENQFKIALEKEQIDGFSELGKLYLRKKELDKAIETFTKGLSLGDPESAHHLGHLYNMMEDFEKSDQMFKKSIELGEYSVVGCWTESIYNAKRVDKKLFARELLEKYKENNRENISYIFLYAKILLWNGEVSDSIDIINNKTRELFETFTDEGRNSRHFHKALSALVDYFILLIAQYKLYEALAFFEKTENDDFKIMLKPVYYLLMEELKVDFPIEYLKAGKELTETINELKKEVEYLRKK